MENGEIIPEKAEYVYMGVRDFSEDECRPTFTFNKKIQRDVICDLKDEPALKGWVEELPEHKEILFEIAKYTKSTRQAASELDHFTYNMSGLLFQGLEEERLADLITIFVNDVKKKPIQWFFKIWINGIHLKCTSDAACECEIMTGVTIRRPIKSDFEFEQRLWSSTGLIENQSSSDAILELSFELQSTDKDPKDEITARIMRLITCLQLFGLGRVYISKSQSHPQSFFTIPFSLPTPLPSVTRYEHYYYYILNEGEIPRLRDFIEKIEPLLPAQIDGETPKNDADIPLSIALERYIDALMGFGSLEHELASACMCLEALYLNDKIQVSHKLRLRVARLLGLVMDALPADIYTDMASAYDVRSTFLHGSLIKTKQRKKLPELTKRITDYGRRSLLVFLLFKQLLDENKALPDGKSLKDEIIEKIEDSQIDGNKCRELRILLEPYIQYLR